MTVGELKRKLAGYDDAIEVVTVRIIRNSKTPEVLEQVYDGSELTSHDEDFDGKVVIW